MKMKVNKIVLKEKKMKLGSLKMGVEKITPVGTININDNGTYDVTYYNQAIVQTPGIIPTGEITITENGTYNVYDKATAVVQTSGIIPSGTLTITQNGTYDVYNKASAEVNCPSDLDWSAIGYSSRPETIVEGYLIAKNINDTFDFSSTTGQAFNNRTDIIFFPKRTFTNLTVGSQYFRSCNSMLELDVDMPNVTNFSQICYQCTSLQKATIRNSKPTNAGNAFYQCSKLKNADLSTCYFYNCTELSSMFQSCPKLTIVNANFTIDSSKDTKTNQAFYGCSKLETAPEISANITQASQMFYNCSQLKNVPYYNLKNCTVLTNMFSGCSQLTDASLNNILLICANCEKITASKTLKTVGLTSAQATTCQSLSNWQTFVNAGWSTGY